MLKWSADFSLSKDVFFPRSLQALKRLIIELLDLDDFSFLQILANKKWKKVFVLA